MRNRISAFVFLLFAIFYNSFSEYKIDYKSNGFVINIKNIEYLENNNQIKIANFDKNSFNLEADSNFQILSFLFAYSDNFSYKILSQNYESAKQFQYFPNLNNKLIDVQKMGKLRNIEMAQLHIFPYKFSAISGTLQLLKSIQIEVNYKLSNPNKEQKLSNSELAFFENVLNFSHLNNLISKKTTEKLLNTNDWYDKNLDYLRIETTQDGVALVKMNKVLEFFPQWRNKSSKYLHLINNGKSIPFYIRNDNGIIDNDAMIYFYGERSKGDSTYWDNYATYNAYFLTYDEKNESPKLSLMQNNSSDFKKINSVNSKFHFENDSIYYWGIYTEGWQLITETTRGEGFYWKTINPRIKFGDVFMTDDKFTSDILITPAENSDAELKFSFAYFAFEDTAKWKGTPPYPPAYYDLNCNVNGNFAARDSFVGWRNSQAYGTLKNNDLFSGKNLIEVLTKEYDPNTNAQAGVDFFTIEGKVTPFAYKSQFYVEDNFNESVNFNVSGFNSNDIALIDTLNKKIAFFEGKSGTTVRLGARESGIPYITLSINDSIISNSRKGLHIFAMNNQSQNKFEYRFYENNFSDAVAYLNSKEANSIINIAYNSQIALSQDVKDLIANLGGIEIKNLNAGNAYIFSAQKGVGKIAEKISTNAIATTSAFYQNDKGNVYETNKNWMQEITIYL